MNNLSEETLSDDRLKKAVSTEIFEKGRGIYLAKHVQVLELKENLATCIIHEKHPYKVEIKVANKFLYLKCDCRYAFRGVVCEHDIAACLAIRDILEKKRTPTWRHQISRILDIKPSSPKKSTSGRYLLFFSIQVTTYVGYSLWKIVPYQLHVTNLLKSGFIGDYLEADKLNQYIQNHQDLAVYLRLPYHMINPEACVNASQESVLLANLLIESAHTYHPANYLPQLDDYLTLIAKTKSPLYIGNLSYPLSKKINIWPDEGELYLSIFRVTEGIRIRLFIRLAGQTIQLTGTNDKNNIQVLTDNPRWLLVDENVFRLSESRQANLLNQLVGSSEITIPETEVDIFRQKYLLALASQIPIESELITWEEINHDPIIRIYLSESNNNIQAEVKFGYLDIEVPYDPQLPLYSTHDRIGSWALVRVIRQPEIESKALSDLSSSTYGMKRSPRETKPGVLDLRARVNPVEFLLHKVPLLIQNGYEVYGEEALKSARVNRNTPTIRLSVSSGIDWFDVKTIVNFGELEVSLKEIRHVLRKKQRFIQLSDGSIGEIPDEWIEHYKHLFALGEETSDGLRLAKYHITLIDQALANSSQSNVDGNYTSQRDRLLAFSGIQSKALPTGFNGELRPYQKSGYEWLHFLHEYGFGGCLADDMGLGKTIQVLVFLQSLKEGLNSPNGKKAQSFHETEKRTQTSLLIVPRSLLVNWQREAARFIPDLKILEYFENNRIKDVSIFDQYDLIITTYGVMLRDISSLRKYRFHIAILDESQAIKNPISQTARAARLLDAHHRLVLTGTPVENSTIELWSQFSYLNPGLLGSLEYFKSEFGIPIEKKGDENSVQLLRKLVYPFILRRTKDQVAPELPPRTERILYCDMETAQRKLYNRTRDYYRGIILGMIEKDGLNNSRFKILEGLLRLRQISNHPRLVDSQYHLGSGKLELLLETLDTLRSEEHKALIFSQFVQMLRILRLSMDEQKEQYLYLDGHTRNRMELVDRFQNDPDIPFFLISLKAGGQGLNLTAADYVIHIDPWWNPAVESQASDRTHRIGQFKPVFIYKLITRDSVEEKILQLQERKKNLVDQIIAAESTFYKSLTEDDVKLLFST